MTAPRVSRFDLELWSRMAKAAEEAARTEDAPTAFGIISALAAYLDAALVEVVRCPYCKVVDQNGAHIERCRQASDRWQRDYDATHPGDLEKSLRRIFGR